MPPVTSTLALSTMFGISLNFIHALARHPEKNYRKFKIRKGKKNREISSPRIALKLIQRWFAQHASSALVFPEYVCGFVPGINGVTEAAKRHCNAKWVFSVDLRDFFGQVSRARIHNKLVALGYPESGADLICQLCLLDDKLPQGSPASPFLSNLAFQETDEKLNLIASKFKCRFSRYADDIVFSGKNEFDPIIEKEVKELLEQERWVLAEDKTEISQLPHRLKVHGLLVHGDKPRLTKGYRNRIRAYKHLLSNERIRADDINKVKSHISYANIIDSI